MNFPSIVVMYFFDLSLIAASIAATTVVAQQWPRLKEMRARASASVVILGIWMQSSVYGADLYSMTLLQYLQGIEVSNKFMADVHTYFAWYTSMFATFFIATGLIMFARQFVGYLSLLEELRDELSHRKLQLDQASTLAKFGYCIFNIENNKVEYCTDIHAKNYGRKKQEYIKAVSTHNNNLELIHPEDKEMVQQKYYEIRDGSTVEIEYRVPSPSGEKIIREIRQPIIDGKSKIIREMATSLDITQKYFTDAELKITRQRLDAAIMGANIGVFDINIQKGESTVSSTWKSLMGFDLESEINAQEEWLARVHPEDLLRVKEADANCIAGKTPNSETEYRIRVADGTWRWMKSVATPHEFSSENVAQRLVGVQLDITELKETEQMKRDFVSTVSHELRTPVSSIHSSLRLLVAKMSAGLPSDTVRFLKIAQRNSDRLLFLINDILDIEKIADQKDVHFNISRLELGELVELAIDSVLPLSEAAGIEIKFCKNQQDNPTLIDPDRFEQILVNLISNAIKFSHEDGFVRVKVESNGTSTRVAITDQGPGISSEFSGKIFERFSKADSSNSRKVQGAGLGLYISKQLVEAMGGQIGFRSEPNVATTFWVSFPTDLNKSLEAATDVAA